jgi:hypothetical protein
MPGEIVFAQARFVRTVTTHEEVEDESAVDESAMTIIEAMNEAVHRDDYEEIEDSCRTMAVRSALALSRTHGAPQLSPEKTRRLTALEDHLRPKDLLSKIRGLVMDSGGSGLEFDDFDDVTNGDYEGATARALSVIEDLGRDAVVDEATFRLVLTRLINLREFAQQV